jgi:3-oxoacyl-[acyl-carrier-protein] synthase III
MGLEIIQNGRSKHTRPPGAACSVCDCESYNLGLTHPVMVLPDTRISARQYFSQSRAPFSLEEVGKYWSDFAIEPECFLEFLKGHSNQQNDESSASQYFSESINILVSAESSSDLAVLAGKELLRQHPGATARIEGVIHYSATLSSRPAWSTPCRLHFELGLKCETAFMVGHKGANVIYAALKVGAEMLHAEGIHKLLLVGSEMFAPPHSRMFSVFSLQGDSANAMMLARDVFDYKLCRIALYDFDGQPPEAAVSTHGEILEFWSERAVVVLTDLIQSSGLQLQKIASVIPPGCSPELLHLIAAKMDMPLEKFDTSAWSRFGSLGSSDLALNLDCLRQSSTLRPGEEIISFGFSSEGSVCGCRLRYEPDRSAQ